MELFGLLQRHRRAILKFIRTQTPEVANTIFDSALQIALGSDNDSARLGGWKEVSAGVFQCGTVQFDVQTAELMSAHGSTSPVPESMCSFPDFETIFSRESLQCTWLQHQTHRKWVEVLGALARSNSAAMTYQLLEWDEPEPLCPGVGAPTIIINDPQIPGARFGDPLDGFWYNLVEYSRPYRYYLTAEQHPPPPAPNPSEQWVVDILQPVLEAVFPKGLTAMKWPLFMPAQALEEGADRCVLVGLAGFSEIEEEEQRMWATYKEVPS